MEHPFEPPIGAVIFGLRRNKGLTQEQLAEAVGVSAPAVSKWETGASWPDIALLAPLARALDTDVNTLLSFSAVCPPDRLRSFLQDLGQQADGDAALAQLRALARRYPGDWDLLFQLASMALGLPVFHNWPEESRDAARTFAQESLEQVRLHGSAKLWPNAAYTLAALYLEAGELDRAEALLDSLPAMTPSPQPLYASLCRRRGETEKARTAIQAQLVLSTQTLLSLLGMLCDPAYAIDDAQARRALEAYGTISEALGFSPVTAKTIAVTTAAQAGRTEEALEALPDLAREAAEGPAPWFLWAEAPVPAGEYHRQMCQTLRGGLLADKVFAPFREDRRYRQALEILERGIGGF